MLQQHLSPDVLQSYTHGLLDKESCRACCEQQTKMAMAAIFAKMEEISKHNQQWSCSDPFWGLPYPYAPVTDPPTPDEILEWEAEHKLRLPAALARALATQDGGYAAGAQIWASF